MKRLFLTLIGLVSFICLTTVPRLKELGGSEIVGLRPRVLIGGGGGNDRCVGLHWFGRTCVVNNVCWDGTSFTVEGDPPGPVGAFPFHIYYKDKKKEFADVSKFNFKKAPRSEKSITIPGVTLLYGEYNAHNIGHVLNDSVLPWFRMLQEFGIKKESVSGIVKLPGVLRYSCTDIINRKGDTHRCDRDFENMFSQHLFGFSITKATSMAPGTCFETVVVGMSHLTDHGFDWSVHSEILPGDLELEKVPVFSGVYLRAFREFLLGGIVPMNPKKMVVVPRDGEDGIKNMDDLINDIRGDYQVTTIDPSKMDSMTDQLNMFADAAVVVITTGGGGLIAQVVPDGATIVLVSTRTSDYAFWHALTARLTIIPVQLEKNLYKRNTLNGVSIGS